MRFHLPILALALTSNVCWAQDSHVPRILTGSAGTLLISKSQSDPKPSPSTPKIKIRVPSSANVPAPPVQVTNLSASEWYVIDGDVPFIIVASPVGIVSANNEIGPVKLKGMFTGGNGKIETRTFTGKQVTTVEATAKGAVELIIIPVGLGSESEILRVSLNVNGAGPSPPPPPPSDAPIAGEGFKVMIFFDQTDQLKMLESQRATIFGVSLRKYLDSKCATGPDGTTKEYRIMDPNSDTSNLSPALREAVKLVKDKTLPMIVISNRKEGKGTGTVVPLPNTSDEIFSLLKKFGGE